MTCADCAKDITEEPTVMVLDGQTYYLCAECAAAIRMFLTDNAVKTDG